jgi:hypothetical protein
VVEQCNCATCTRAVHDKGQHVCQDERMERATPREMEAVRDGICKCPYWSDTEGAYVGRWGFEVTDAEGAHIGTWGTDVMLPPCKPEVTANA